MSKRQEKIERNKLEQASFLEDKKKSVIEQRWENAQMQAATWQSVLNYAVDQFNEHKAELDLDIIEKTEDQIKERQNQIKDFLMAEKELYLESIGLQQD